MSCLSSLRILIAHPDNSTREEIIEALDDTHEVIATCDTLRELRRLYREVKPELVVVGVEFRDGDGIDTMIELGEEDPTPTVIVTANRSISMVEKAMQDHVMAYLIEPVRPQDIEAAIVVACRRHDELNSLREEVDSLREALENRKLIERAKGMLMASEGLTEDEAFARLRRDAQDNRTRMVDVAERLMRLEAE